MVSPCDDAVTLMSYGSPSPTGGHGPTTQVRFRHFAAILFPLEQDGPLPL